MAVVCRKDSPFLAMLQTLSDPQVLRCVEFERAIVRGLGAQCQSPVGVHVVHTQGRLHVRVFVGSLLEDHACVYQQYVLPAQVDQALDQVLAALEKRGAHRLLKGAGG